MSQRSIFNGDGNVIIDGGTLCSAFRTNLKIRDLFTVNSFVAIRMITLFNEEFFYKTSKLIFIIVIAQAAIIGIGTIFMEKLKNK